MIPVQNVYYMLSYAFQVLNEKGYKKLATEEFNNVADLCAAILIKGVSVQLKRGLRKDYLSKSEPLSSLRGRIDIVESVKTQSMMKKQMVCTYDDFLENSYMNRIIKSTMVLLLKADVARERKRKIRKLLLYFDDVELLDIYSVDWRINYNRNNQHYRMMNSICYLIIKGLLQTTSEGKIKLMDFFDEQRMCRLYEKFILGYYRKEFPELNVKASKIKWDVDDGFDDSLPIMQSDITISNSKGDNVLIIDAKYYSHMMREHFGINKLHSENLYQIFTYVKNMDSGFKGIPHTVSGIILYARTDEEFQFNKKEYSMSGNQISARTLDLDCSFKEIAKQLNEIVESYFCQDCCKKIM